MVSSRRWQAVTHRQTVALSKSGGRQPAVGMKRICNGARFFPGGSTFAYHGWLTPAALGCSTCGCLCRYALLSEEDATFATAGLRQPLFVHGAGRPKNNDTRGAQTHVLHERRVSARRGPGIAPATARVLPDVDAPMPRGAYAPPLLVLLQCGDFPAKLRLVRCTNARLQERRVSARRGNETHLQWRGFLFRNEYARTPRLAYASRSWCTASVDRKITTFAVHERSFTRAAGVSPPWVDKIASAYTTAIRWRTADGVCADCPCIRVFRRHGGLTPPALGGSTVRRFPGETATCAVHKRTFCTSGGRQSAVGMVSSRRWQAVTHRQTLALSKSGGRQPAVGMKRACNGAGFFSGTSTFAHHGWLTPAALGCSTCGCLCRYALLSEEDATFATAGLRQPLLVHGIGRPKNNDIRGAQTHVFQERRVSARRGNETHLQWCGFFSRNEYVRAPRLAYASRSWLQHVRMSLQICAS
jgi:hypothetical protein